MTWVRIEDSMVDHAKVAALGNAAFRLHIEGMCWVARNLTDGQVPEGVARRYGSPRSARELVAAGIWHQTSDGYEIHDYLDYNPSREEVEELRAKRSEAGRRGGKRSKPPSKTEAKHEANAQALAKQMLKQNRSKTEPRVPIPLEVDPSGSTSGARPRNEHWDALAEIFNYSPETRTEQKDWGQHCRDFKAMGLSASDVHEVSRRYSLSMPNVEKTPRALVRNAQRLLAQQVAKRQGGLSASQLIQLGGELERHRDSTGHGGRQGGLSELAAGS